MLSRLMRLELTHCRETLTAPLIRFIHMRAMESILSKMLCSDVTLQCLWLSENFAALLALVLLFVLMCCYVAAQTCAGMKALAAQDCLSILVMSGYVLADIVSNIAMLGYGVGLEMFGSHKGLIAAFYVAGERSFMRMRAEVNLKTSWSVECLLTSIERAVEGLWPLLDCRDRCQSASTSMLY